MADPKPITRAPLPGRVARWPLGGRLAVAVSLVVLCWFTRRWLEPVIGFDSPFSLFYIGVAFTAYLARTLPAAVAALLSAALVDYSYIGQKGVFDFSATTLGLQSIFLAVCAVVIATNYALRRSQEALAQRAAEIENQRRWLETTFSGIGDGVIATDADGKITFLNPAAEALTGWSSADAKSKPVEAVFDIVHEVTREKVANPIAEALRAGRAVKLADRTVLRAKSGREIAIEDSASPICEPAGGIIGAVMVFSDVTERRRNADALQTAESRKAAVLDASLDAIITMEQGGNITDFNRAAETIFGYRAEEAIGKPLADLIIPERFRERHRQGLARLVATGEARVVGRRLELSALHADGHEFPVELSISRIAGITPPMFTGTLRDISERKRVEQSLRSSEERQRAVFEQAAVGIAVAGLDGRLLELNAKAVELFGYPLEELKQHTFLELTHPDDVAPTRECVRRLVAGEIAHYALEKRYVRKNGSLVWSLTTVTVLRGADGSPVQMIGVLEDITARKLAEEAVKENEAVLRVVTNESRVGLVMVNSERRYLFANATYLQVLGIPPGSIIGKHVQEVLPEVYDQIEPRLSRALAGERVEYELFVPPKDETRGRYYEVIYEPRKAGTSEAYVVVVLVDITKRKENEERLQHKEQDLRAMADSIPQLAWMAEPDGTIFWYNRGWFDYTGTTLEQMQGWGWQEVHDPKILPEVTARWQESLRSGSPFEMEFPLRGADGVFRWFLTRVNPLRDADGRVQRWFGTNTNVDEVRRTREALQEETRNLELLNDTGAAIASKLDLEALVQTVTDAATKLSGAKFGAFFYNVINEAGESFLLYALSGAPRQAFERFGLPRNTPIFDPTFRGQGVVRSADITKDPRYGTMSPHHGMPKGHLPVCSYLAVPVVSRSGEVIGGLFFGHPEPDVFTDRSERLVVAVAAQAAIAIDNARLYESAQREIATRREMEARLRVALDASSLGTWEYNPMTKRLALDERCQALFGLANSPTIELETFFALAHPDDRLRRRELLERVLERGEEYVIEYRTAGTPTRWLRASGRSVTSAAGEVTRVITAVAEITDLVKARETLVERGRELEEQVQARTASLQEAISQMEEFSYSVSHDLRAPLRAITGYADAIVEDYGRDLDPTVTGYLGRIASAATRMDRLTQDVLVYSRVARENMKLESLSLDRIVRETIEQYVPDDAVGFIAVEHPLLEVRAHEALLVQAVSNLVLNALKFVPSGRRPEIRIWTTKVGANVRLSIRDNGIGVPVESQSRIWGLFERVHPRSHFEGTGVGLAVVRKAAERMGGSAGVASDGENGSEFWLDLLSSPPSVMQ